MSGSAVRLHTPAFDAPCFPLDEPAADLLFGGRPLRQWQQEAAEALGLKVVDVHDGDPLPPDARVAFAANVLFDVNALRSLVAASSTKLHQAVLRAGTPLRWLHRLTSTGGGDLPLPLWAGPVLSRTSLADLETSAPAHHAFDDGDGVDGVELVDVRPYGARHPDHPAALQGHHHHLLVATPAHLVGWPRHWLEVLDLSLAALRTRLRAEGAAANRGSRGRRRSGWGAQIHPTCIVENALLGEGVRLEAHVSIRNSVIGDGVLVADHSVIEGSVIGDGCRTLVDTHLRRVVAMGGSTLSNLDMQDAIFGREIFLTTGVAFFHDGPGRNVVVDPGGNPSSPGVDSGRAVLSGAIGRRAVLGSRALLRSGTALPAGALVVARPEEALGRVDERGLGRAAMTVTWRAPE